MDRCSVEIFDRGYEDLLFPPQIEDLERYDRCLATVIIGDRGKIRTHPLFEKKDRLDNDLLWG